jgi:hypothetical protein
MNILLGCLAVLGTLWLTFIVMAILVATIEIWITVIFSVCVVAFMIWSVSTFISWFQ